ncbi:phosphate ABC transporter ATP-binding protein [Algiphilus sp.]|uniref:phosphate ABC transporter ATP-binding protein n=1 Tax=Algiphilus sp. TaxID=1872431 RepID=UPI003B517FD6
MHQPAFELQEVAVRYGERAAVSGVNLNIPAHAITAFIGPSGCGKTSLLSSFNRMTDLFAGCRVEGAIRMADQDVLAADCDTVQLRRRVGMIFQKPNPFPLSVRRNIELALIEHGYAREARETIIEGVLRDVGLWAEVCDRLDRSALQLSGGQQQRLCIARALALEPEVLLMDEPCSALDPMASGVVEDLILRLGQRLTVIIVTHNLQQAQRIADVTGAFWTEDGVGRLVEWGSTEQVFEQPQDARAAAYVQGRCG